jgi:hypothetical protein
MTDETGGALRPEPPTTEQNAGSNHDRIRDHSEHARPAASPAENHPDNETEETRRERHRGAERRHWTFEKIGGSIALFFTFVAAAGAILSAIAAFGAWDAANKSAEYAHQQWLTAQFDQRPWVKPPDIEVEFLGDKIFFNPTYENVGRIPTEGFYADVIIVPESERRRRGAEYCAELKKLDQDKGPGFRDLSIFPHGIFKDWHRGEMFFADFDKIAGPFLVGCALYGWPRGEQFQSGNPLRQTGFLAPLNKSLIPFALRKDIKSLPYVYATTVD